MYALYAQYHASKDLLMYDKLVKPSIFLKKKLQEIYVHKVTGTFSVFVAYFIILVFTVDLIISRLL